MYLRAFLLIAILFIVMQTCLAQRTIDVLSLKEQIFFIEKNVFTTDSLLNIKQRVCFDQPQSADDEYCYTLLLNFNKLSKKSVSKIFGLEKDTLFLTCSFLTESSWKRLTKNRVKISGTITILSWANESIRIRFNCKLIDEKYKTTYEYIGERTFVE
ncbi:MAG: hypothetical protein JJE22_19255 [Bacteroidia bacterium]|nr:hypothetical protein [Bacteroidia bacterium]